MLQPRNIAVIGLGYVGCVSAACLAKIGHVVCGADRDPNKVNRILAGEPPFYEPGLAELVEETVRAGRFTATVSTAEALREAEIALIAVGTPSQEDGNVSLDQLGRVLAEIEAALAGRSQPLIVAVRSTVPPGTWEEMVAPAFGAYPQVIAVSNPEFLREGSAVADFMAPSLVVVGGADAEAMRAVAALYEPLGVPPALVEPRTAEMIKFACNAFHALKISFANEMGTLCGALGIDGQEVMGTLCQDVRLNISPAYLRPGFAFGGSCLSKDLRALTAYAERLALKLPVLGATLPSNREHLDRAIARVLEMPAERLGIIGLAFKENTDDLRESPVVTLIGRLLGRSRKLRIYDPHIQLPGIYGSNREFILQAVPEIDRLIEDRLDDVLDWAECLVITQKLPAELADQVQSSGLRVVDLSGTWTAGDTSGGGRVALGHIEG